MRLKDKTALITGGTSGIGLAAARAFAREGARVALCARNGERAERLAAELGPGNVGIAMDVGKVASIADGAARAAEALGGLDIVFANAGISRFKPLDQWTEEDFDALFTTNAKGQFFTVQKSVPYMREGGVVILTGSISSKTGQPNMALYGASKAVAPAFAKSLSADLLPRRIRVLCLTPGPTKTAIFDPDGPFGAAAEATLERLKERVPIGRAADAAEQGEVVLFLASDDSAFMLGTEVVVDGGKSQL
jgi:NAD(P)-dependent dehydrogenase (short-subunit alcohol dehydrogenase family)